MQSSMTSSVKLEMNNAPAFRRTYFSRGRAKYSLGMRLMAGYAILMSFCRIKLHIQIQLTHLNEQLSMETVPAPLIRKE